MVYGNDEVARALDLSEKHLNDYDFYLVKEFAE